MENKKINIDPTKIHLLNIEEVDSSYGLESVLGTDMVIGIAHLSGFNIEDSKFLFGLELIFAEKGNEENPLLKFRYNFHYLVDNLNEMYTLLEDGKPQFERMFAATIAGISYSTLRGIIFEKTAGLNDTGIIAPIINPSNILESWISQS